jgi:hypothetical protein
MLLVIAAGYSSLFADKGAGPPPDGLGRGLQSTTGELQGLLVPPDGAEFEPMNDISFSLNFVDDRSSFASTLAWSAKAKLDLGANSGSARASLSQSHHRSEQRVDLVVTKVVHTGKHFLRDPRVRKEALDLHASKGAKTFYDRYGDQLVRSVVRGGALFLIYQFQFDSASAARDFRLSVEAKVGGSRGGMSLHRTLLEGATKAAITVQGVCIGVNKAPPVFIVTPAPDKKTARIEGHDPLAEDLVRYFSEFEDSVADDSAAPLAFESVDIAKLVNAPNRLTDVATARELLEKGVALDDEIDGRLAELEYLRDVAYEWNPHVSRDDVAALIEDLNTKANALRGSLRDIAQLKSDRLPFDLSDLPSKPQNWIARDLRSVGGKRFQMVNEKRSVEIDVPPLYDGQPVAVDLAVKKVQVLGGDPGTIVVSWGRDDGQGRIEFTQELVRLPIGRTTLDEKKTYAVIPPRGARRLRVQVLTYGSAPVVGSIGLRI